MRLEGFVEVRKNGLVVAAGRNRIVSGGRSAYAAILNGEAVAGPAYMGVGNSGTASTDTMTALQGTEFERVALSRTRVANTLQYTSASFGAGIALAQTLREWGLFDLSSAGTMFARFLCAPQSFTPGDTFTVTWSITLGD